MRLFAILLPALIACPGDSPGADMVPVTLACRPAPMIKYNIPGYLPMEVSDEIWCLGAAKEGRYHMALEVKNPNDEAVLLERVVLDKVTPRPVQKPWQEKYGPLDRALEVRGLPTQLAAKALTVLDVAGGYVMDDDEYDQSQRVNLHLVVEGRGVTTGGTVEVELTAHLLPGDDPETLPGHGGNGPPATRLGTEPLEGADYDSDSTRGKGGGTGAGKGTGKGKHER